uniref:Uncharacterized protein n=1 Tax=Oryza glaberrima TaxID=4538 RepID=I1QZH8_ORYGL
MAQEEATYFSFKGRSKTCCVVHLFGGSYVKGPVIDPFCSPPKQDTDEELLLEKESADDEDENAIEEGDDDDRLSWSGGRGGRGG